MASKKRQDIISAVDTRMKAILVTGGYETDLGENVIEYQLHPPDPDELPFLSYRDTGADSIDRDNVYEYKKLNLEIGIKVSSSTALSDVRKYIRDVLKAVKADLSWGKNAYETVYEGDTISAQQEENVFADVLIKIGIYYQTLLWED